MSCHKVVESWQWHQSEQSEDSSPEFFPDQSWEDWSGKKLSAVADKPRDAFVQYAAEADPLKHANPYVLPRRICLF